MSSAGLQLPSGLKIGTKVFTPLLIAQSTLLQYSFTLKMIVQLDSLCHISLCTLTKATVSMFEIKVTLQGDVVTLPVVVPVIDAKMLIILR